MDIPGERLLIKLWETITEKGIGNLLQPWQERRVGLTRIEMKKKEIIAIAEAEKLAEAIRQNDIQFENPLLLNFKDKHGDRIEPSFAIQQLCFNANKNTINDTIRKEINLSKALLFAEDQLTNQPAEPVEETIDDDWLYKWKEFAGQISSEKLQQLWGSILAGEHIKPGTYSYRTLDFLRHFSTADAKLIELASQFIIAGRIFRGQEHHLEPAGLSFSKLLYLQEIGFLSGVESVGLTTTWKSSSRTDFLKVLPSHNKCLIITSPEQNRSLPAETYLVSKVGIELMQLAKVIANDQYLISIGNNFKTQNFNVTFADWIWVDSNSGNYQNGIQL